MAKGKKGNATKYVSNNERPNVSLSTLRGVNADRPPMEKMLNQVNAWSNGKNPKIAKQNGWGDPRKAIYLEGKR